jgi:hypothetical protein
MDQRFGSFESLNRHALKSREYAIISFKAAQVQMLDNDMK